MRWRVTLAAALLAAGLGQPARAENCNASLDYILNQLGGDLPRPAETYRGLLKTCLQALSITNVRDAYLLKDGGVAVVPKRDTLMSTAQTLADFCREHKSGKLRFVSRKEMRKHPTTGFIVLMSSAGSPSCEEVRGK